jgi:hypothetical protein
MKVNSSLNSSLNINSLNNSLNFQSSSAFNQLSPDLSRSSSAVTLSTRAPTLTPTLTPVSSVTSLAGSEVGNSGYANNSSYNSSGYCAPPVPLSLAGAATVSAGGRTPQNFNARDSIGSATPENINSNIHSASNSDLRRSSNLATSPDSIQIFSGHLSIAQQLAQLKLEKKRKEEYSSSPSSHLTYNNSADPMDFMAPSRVEPAAAAPAEPMGMDALAGMAPSAPIEMGMGGMVRK